MRRRRYSRKRKQHKSFGRALSTLVALAAGVALTVSYLALFLNPSGHPGVMFFGLYFIPLALLNLLILIVSLMRGRRTALIPILALVPALLLADRLVRIGRPEPVESKGREVKVLTYNLGRYHGDGRRITPEAAVAGIREYLEGQDADIVCLQEFSVRDTSLLSEILPSYPYRSQHLFKGERFFFGNVTLSKLPIVRSEAFTFPQSRNLSLVTDLEVGGSPVRVYNCHLESYSISFTTLVKRLFRKDHFTDEVIQVHGRLREATRRRTAQVEKILSSDAASTCPSIVCGDFNDSPLSYTYQQLMRRKIDSFVESGRGFGATYSVLWPMFRIDYILLPQESRCSDHATDRIPWSDHYPVTTSFYLE